MISLDDWIRFHGTFQPDRQRKVQTVEFQIQAKDAVSSITGVDRKPIHFTDIQFQPGNALSGWNPNTREMLQRLSWTHDENESVATPARFEGSTPRIYTGVNRRWFNILGRGHQTITIPNYLPEDWDVTILPTGIDLTIYPKEDFDLLRVSTAIGVQLPEDEQFYTQSPIYQEMKRKYEEAQMIDPEYASPEDMERKKTEISNFESIIQPLLGDNPLHYRYTREFWVQGATAGSEIRILATPRQATINGSTIKIQGERSLNVHDRTMNIDRKKFLLAPRGVTPIRIEFYKKKTRKITTYDQDENWNYYKVNKTFEYMEDVGIGYFGTAAFSQWTYGRSRV